MASRSILRISAVLLAAALWAPPACWADAPPASGSWTVTGTVVLENGTYYINGSTTVENGAVLVFQNARIVLAIPQQMSLTVEEGGRLVGENSSLESTFQDRNGLILVHGTADLSRCNLSSVDVMLEAGSKGYFDQCSFRDQDLPIQSYDAHLRVANCLFLGDRGTCIRARGGDVGVAGCRFFASVQDELNVSYPGSFVAPERALCNVSANLFSDFTYGIRATSQDVGHGGTDGPPAIAYSDIDGSGLALQRNVVSGFYYGAKLILGSSYLMISENDIRDGVIGLDTTFMMENSTSVLANRVERCRTGLVFGHGTWEVERNEISDCTAEGLRSGYNPGPANPVSITSNTIRRCTVGAGLTDLAGAFYENILEDCSRCGADIAVNDPVRPPMSVRRNDISRCGRDASEGMGFGLRVAYRGWVGPEMHVEGNVLSDDPRVGVIASDWVSLNGNTIINSSTGVRVETQGYGVPEITGNFIQNGEAGLEVRCPCLATGNDIMGTATGVLFRPVLRLWQGTFSLDANSVHATGTAVRLENPLADRLSASVTNNILGAGGDAVLIDQLGTYVAGNDFGGTRGHCIHAIGAVATMGTNQWGNSSSGRLRQDWYLTVGGMEKYGGSFVPSRHFEVRARDSSGRACLQEWTGEDTYLRAPLKAWTIDREGTRSATETYNVTILKPRVGVGLGHIELLNNSQLVIDMVPRSDLAVADLKVAHTRPLADELVNVDILVALDSSYDPSPSEHRDVWLLVTDDDRPVFNRTLDRLLPGEQASATFFWTAEPDTHVLSALVDPFNIVDEAFEDNNRLSVEVPTNLDPVPVLAVSSSSASVGEALTFRGDASTDDLGVSEYNFSFGDGAFSGWTGDGLVTHAYQRTGFYEARLRVRDRDGAESDWSPPAPIIVGPRLIEASLRAERTALDTLEEVNFSVETRATPPLSYTWSFGDGATQYGHDLVRASHSYGRPGTYLLAVTVSDESGSNGTASLWLTVRNRLPRADFSSAPSGPTVLDAVRFLSRGSDPDGTITGWLWDFGDRWQSFEPGPSHTYSDDGTFTVTHAVRDDSGAWSPLEARSVVVQNLPPLASARSSKSSLPVGEVVQFDARASTDPDDSFSSLVFRWSCSDGWQATGPNVSRRFLAPGGLVIGLTVTDDDGAVSAEYRLRLTVLEPPGPAADPAGPVLAAMFLSIGGALVALSLVLLRLSRKAGTGKARAGRRRA